MATKLVFLGDIHGDFVFLNEVMKRTPDDVKIIQVGDFGFWPQKERDWRRCIEPARPVYFIDGDHDYTPGLNVHGELPEQLWDGRATHVPRGVVLGVSGVKILFCGGSKSVDRNWRVKDSVQHGWFEDEQLTEADVERALDNVARAGGVDIMVTHAPPDRVIREHFHEDGLRSFGHDPRKWVDESALLIQRLHDELGCPPLFCGHMRRSVTEGSVRILGINEMVIWEK